MKLGKRTLGLYASPSTLDTRIVYEGSVTGVKEYNGPIAIVARL